MEQYVRKLYEVERYHRKLAKILDGQFSVEKEQVQGEIVALQEQLQAVRGQIRELGFVGSVSKEFLDRHSELKGRIDALKLQNEAYLTLLDLQDARKKREYRHRTLSGRIAKNTGRHSAHRDGRHRIRGVQFHEQRHLYAEQHKELFEEAR